MLARFVLISAAFVSASAFAADAPKPPMHPAAQPDSPPPAVVLASADQLHSQSADQQAPAQPKHRVARVTTCRCGDPQASDPEAQPER